MLSTMESSPGRPTPAEATAALADADESRARLARGIVVPPWFAASLGVAIAVQLATTAVGIADGRVWTLVAGLALFAAVAGVQLARFRRRNGVWLGGLASRVVLGTGMAASLSYAAALAAAVWAASAEQWWLTVLCAIAGGAAYALRGLRGLRAYRAQPARHARGESLGVLALIALAAVAGLLLLLLGA
jgi:hypothetical protein